MQEIFELVEKYLEGVELKSFTDEQKVKLQNNYNCKLYFFDYALNKNGDLVVKTKRNNYTSLLYYMGVDSTKNDYIKLKIEVEDLVLVIYNIENERVAGLAKKLSLID